MDDFNCWGGAFYKCIGEEGACPLSLVLGVNKSAATEGMAAKMYRAARRISADYAGGEWLTFEVHLLDSEDVARFAAPNLGGLFDCSNSAGGVVSCGALELGIAATIEALGDIANKMNCVSDDAGMAAMQALAALKKIIKHLPKESREALKLIGVD